MGASRVKADLKSQNIQNDQPFGATIMRKPRTRKEATKGIVSMLKSSDSESPVEIQYTIKEKRKVRQD